MQQHTHYYYQAMEPTNQLIDDGGDQDYIRALPAQHEAIDLTFAMKGWAVPRAVFLTFRYDRRLISTSIYFKQCSPFKSFYIHTHIIAEITKQHNTSYHTMSYKAGIVEAIQELKDRTGSSTIALKKIMQGKLPADKKWQNTIFLSTLKKAVTDGDFVQVKNSYKLSADFKKALAKKEKDAAKKDAAPKAKKPATKKKPAAKKTTAASKKTAPKKKAAAKKTAASKKTAPKKKAAPKKAPATKKSAPKKKASAKKAAPKKKTSTKKKAAKE